MNLDNNWLSIIEYSNKYGISVSTLRRRIRRQEIKCRQVDGKYFLEEMGKSSKATSKAESMVKKEEKDISLESVPMSSNRSDSELLNELKSAFRLVLQEKEEQIYLMKEDNAHLLKLISVLEEEVGRLKSVGKEKDRQLAVFSQNLYSQNLS